MASEFDYLESTIPWPMLRSYLERRLAACDVDSVTTTEGLWEIRGARRAIKSLLNLPQALILEEEAKRNV